MKKLLLTIVAATTFLAVNAQTYVSNINAQYAKVSATEEVYYAVNGQQLTIYDMNFTALQTVTLPSRLNSKIYASYLTKSLFDNDADFEVLLSFSDSTNNNRNVDLLLYDFSTNTGSRLPNWSPANLNNVFIYAHNTINGADLRITNYHSTGGFTSLLYRLQGSVLRVKEIGLEHEEQALFPNPTVDKIKVIGQNGETAVIYDANGRIVQTEKLTGLETQIDVTALPNGAYVIMRSNGVSNKFVKQ